MSPERWQTKGVGEEEADSGDTLEVAARTGDFLDVRGEAEDTWVSDVGMGMNAKWGPFMF